MPKETTETIEVLSAKLLELKKVENKAKRERGEIEVQIAELFGDAPKEGSKTNQFGGFKITVKNGINVKADLEKIKELIPAGYRPIKAKEELDKTGVEWLKENQPDLYKVLAAECLTSKPAKVSVTVKEVE